MRLATFEVVKFRQLQEGFRAVGFLQQIALDAPTASIVLRESNRALWVMPLIATPLAFYWNIIVSRTKVQEV